MKFADYNFRFIILSYKSHKNMTMLDIYVEESKGSFKLVA